MSAPLPDGPVTIDARVAIGDIRVDGDDEVTVEVRSRIDDGTLRVDGRREWW